MTGNNDSRTWFAQATAGVLEAIELVPYDLWSQPGLGSWTVRELVAHTVRAWTTTSTYLSAALPDEDAPVVSTPQYFVRALATPGVHDGIAQRARDDVAELGPDPLDAARAHAARTTRIVDALPDDRRLLTPGGVMLLGDYLSTRAFELTVHGLDLCRAIDLDPPTDLARAAQPALILATQVAIERGLAEATLEALTGRTAFAQGLNVLA
ncbi:MAG: maleylpyruvate isomerase N-terminal domain-containing protein [Phycicoccus sp.]|nr:maleylpyruvate isomerase N-terminal domain-containing protein [Phycicoccus sp.]